MRAALICAFAILISCGDPSPDVDLQNQMTAPTSLAVDLDGSGFPLTVELGDPTTFGVDSAQVKWNEEAGQLEVRAGDRFGILITEEPGDLARLKADLQRDQLRTSTIVEEKPDRMVWRSTFPDEEIVFVHFYRVVEADGRMFVVQDDDHGRYSEADVYRMVDAVRTKQPV